MPIIKVPTPTGSTPSYVPDIETDYNAQNDNVLQLISNSIPHLAIPVFVDSTIIYIEQNVILNFGGVLYYATEDIAVESGSGPYIRLVKSTDGESLTASLTLSPGTWNPAYKGFYDGANLIMPYNISVVQDIQTDIATVNSSVRMNDICFDPDGNLCLADVASSLLRRYVGFSNTPLDTLSLTGIAGCVNVNGNLFWYGITSNVVHAMVGFSTTEDYQFTVATPEYLQGITYDGTNLIVSDRQLGPNCKIYVLDGIASPDILSTITGTVTTTGGEIFSLGHDGHDLLMTSFNGTAAPDENTLKLLTGNTNVIKDSRLFVSNDILLRGLAYYKNHFYYGNNDTPQAWVKELDSSVLIVERNSLGLETVVTP